MKQLLLLFSLILVVVNGARFHRRQEENQNLQPEYQTAENISYGQYDANKLDVYYDNNSLNTLKPVIIYIHGGYWCEGDKQEDAAIGTLIQDQSYVAVLPNYRLYPVATSIDDMVEDIYNVFSWVKNNIASYGGDIKKVSLVGFNAGAHIGSLTVLKSYFKMVVNGIKLSKLISFKHLILYNSPYSFDKFERLEFDINKMRETALSDPSLAYLENYANAKEGLFLNQSGYDEVELLEDLEDLSIYNIGTDKVTFVECDKDTNYPIGSSLEMMEEIKRVVDDIEIVKKVYPGEFDYVIQGVKNNDPETTNIFLKLMNSIY